MQLPSPEAPAGAGSENGPGNVPGSAADSVSVATSGASSAAGEASAPTESGRRTVSVRVLATRLDVVLVALAALVATVLGRGVLPALPGSTTGIGSLITGVEQVAAFATQFMAVLGVSTCVRILLSTLDCPSRTFRWTAVIVSAAALPVVISASSRHLPPAWLISLVGLSAGLGIAAARPALRAAHSRAAGLMLLTVTLGSLVSGFGRVLALYASQEVEAGLYGVARAIATLGLGIDALGVCLAAIWLTRRSRLGTALAAFLASVAAAVVWFGAKGGDPAQIGSLGVFVGRTLESLTAHPNPFVQAGFRYFVEIYALLVAAATLWFRRPPGVGETLTFALLARVSGDVPSCALMLLLAAFCAVRASLQPVRPHEGAVAGRRASLEVVPVTR
ncbi:MAG: hypothetical protein RL685_7345 [Pseudomonadota bacterium]